MSRFSNSDLHRIIINKEESLIDLSRISLARILAENVLKPWRYSYWLFPRDPDFVAKTCVVLDLYAGFWQGQRLGPDEYILSADEKTIQVLRRCHPTFWIVDGGCAHHPSTFPARLQGMYPNAVAVPLPTHSSWLNQIEIYFSIVQRKVLTPMDTPDDETLTKRLLDFQDYYQETAKPFNWKITAADLRDDLTLSRTSNVALP
jgi:hypothetical protein